MIKYALYQDTLATAFVVRMYFPSLAPMRFLRLSSVRLLQAGSEKWITLIPLKLHILVKLVMLLEKLITLHLLYGQRLVHPVLSRYEYEYHPNQTCSQTNAIGCGYVVWEDSTNPEYPHGLNFHQVVVCNYCPGGNAAGEKFYKFDCKLIFYFRRVNL